MYDPVMVDTFVKVRPPLTSVETSGLSVSEAGLKGLNDVTTRPAKSSPAARLHDIAASTEEMLVLYDLAQALSGRVDFADAADMIAKHLRRIVPASTCVFYLYDNDKDDLVAAHSSGEHASYFIDLRIPRGQRLSGWVAANRQSILNSDPVLDLGDAVRHLRPSLVSCLSTPLISEPELVGVLTVYSTHVEAFTEDHRRLLEVVGRQVSATVKAGRRDATSAGQSARVPGLTDSERFKRFVAAEIEHAFGSRLAIVVIRTHQSGGRQGTSPSPFQIAAGISKVLRGGDVLSCYSDDEFVVALTQTDYLAATVVGSRILDTVTHTIGALGSGCSACIGIAATPDDGTSLDELVRSARERCEPNPPLQRRPAIH